MSGAIIPQRLLIVLIYLRHRPDDYREMSINADKRPMVRESVSQCAVARDSYMALQTEIAGMQYRRYDLNMKAREWPKKWMNGSRFTSDIFNADDREISWSASSARHHFKMIRPKWQGIWFHENSIYRRLEISKKYAPWSDEVLIIPSNDTRLTLYSPIPHWPANVALILMPILICHRLRFDGSRHTVNALNEISSRWKRFRRQW